MHHVIHYSLQWKAQFIFVNVFVYMHTCVGEAGDCLAYLLHYILISIL